MAAVLPVINMQDLPLSTDRAAAYRTLLEAGPVCASGDGAFLVTSRRGAKYVLSRPKTYSSEIVRMALAAPVDVPPVSLDGERHTAMRELLNPLFTPRATFARAESVRAQINALIDTFIDAGACDITTDLAVPLPTSVFLDLFGMPAEDRDRLNAWQKTISEGANPFSAVPQDKVQKATGELLQYLRGHIQDRWDDARSQPHGMLTELVAATHDGRLRRDDLLGAMFLFVLAGLGTVASQVSTAFAMLARDQNLRAEIVDDPGVIPTAVEEFLRLDPPAPFLPRLATKDTTLYGHPIKEGSVVTVAICAANRDLPNGHKVNLRRSGRSLGFGWGAHTCLGVNLALIQLQQVLETFFRRIPNFWLQPGTETSATRSSSVRVDHVRIEFPPGGERA